jgi:AbrB family looped-hinge helix DNA binding protein
MKMEKTRLSSKGQVILPKAIRESRRWRPGTEFVVEDAADGVILRPTKPMPPSRLDEVARCLNYKGKPKSLRQMESAIAAETRARRARGRY